MPGIKLSDGRWVEPNKLCTSCQDGKFFMVGLRTVIKHLNTDMYKEIWKCDKCGNTSIRRWTK